MGGKIKGYKAPRTRQIDGKSFRLEQSTKKDIRAQNIATRLSNKGWNVRVLPAPKSSQYKYEIYKRKGK